MRLAAVLLFSVLGLPSAHGFSEMARHGYQSCSACHVSPDGGGVLTPYGRSLSRELLSRWGAEGQEGFLHGAIRLPEWLQLGGDLRAIQSLYHSSTRERARFIFMQADVEAAATVGQWTVAATLGRQDASSVNATGGTVFSRRHYVLFRPAESLAFRVGRFYLPYGISLADHFVAIKRSLRWDEGSESYNLEASWLGEGGEAFLFGTLGRPDAPSLNRDKGAGLRAARFLGETHKLGGSYFFGTSPLGNRHVVGPFAILGLSPHWFVLAEVNLQHLAPAVGGSSWGAVSYLRLDHEPWKGVHFYLSHDFSRLDWQNPATQTMAFGLGAQFFPIPHVELQGAYWKQRISAIGSEYADFLWAIAHYYF